MLDGPRLRQRQELTWMLGQRLIDGKVTMVHLINHDILRHAAHGLVTLPPFWVCVAHIDNDTLLAIHTHRFGKDTRREIFIDKELIGMSLAVAFSCSRPDAVGTQRHRQHLIVHHNIARGIGRRKESEYCLAGRVGHLVEMKHLLF